jgi:hypothetical protein
MMRKVLSGVALAVALSQSAAAQPIVGFAELSYGHLSTNSGGTSASVPTLGVSANVPVAAGGWNFEFEGWASSLIVGGMGGGSLMGLYGHAYMRDPTNWAGGLMVGYENIIAGTTMITYYAVGLEAAKFWGPAVLLAQAKWGTVTTSGTSANLASVDGVARYYINPNLKAEAGIRYSVLSAGGTSASFWTAHGEVEAGLGSSVSAFVAARHLFGSGLSGTTVTTLTGGIRLNFNTGSIMDQSTAGALWDTQNFFIF